jgi:OPA family glycerol-3-phosphate transporter-like MFS transporter
VICIAFIGQALCLLLLRGFIHSAWGACAALVLISFFVQSAHSLVGGAASMDFGGRKAVATAAGLFDGAQYLAGSLVGAGMGRLLDHYRRADQPGAEFAAWPILPLGFAILGALIISRLWHALPGRSAHGPTPTSSLPSPASPPSSRSRPPLYGPRPTLAPEEQP